MQTAAHRSTRAAESKSDDSVSLPTAAPPKSDVVFKVLRLHFSGCHGIVLQVELPPYMWSADMQSESFTLTLHG